ncbi:MAG: WbqC family protein [Flavobacteriales bacterium]
MKSVLLPIHLFPSIEYYAYLVQAKYCIFEGEDHYQKQTYRNRYTIYGSNGKLNLNIPIQHKTDSRYYKDTKISYDTDWQHLHIKSLKSAYQSSPFFEFYEDDIIPLFTSKETYLMDFNIKSFILINDLIQFDIKIEKTTEYLHQPELFDLRNHFNTKKESHQEFEPYIQVFSQKKEFIKNLSILDLLFNEGTNTLTYLKKHKIKNK